MPERSQRLALALLFSCMLALSTGCTSSRMLKPQGKGFGWLGGNKGDMNLQNDSLDFPPPSSLEIPQSVSNQSIDQARGIAQSARSAVSSPTAPQQPSLANGDHPMVQNGLYGDGLPTSPAIPTAVATNLPKPQFVDPTVNPTVLANPSAPTTQLASASMITPATSAHHHERSIYEMESAATSHQAAAATYAAPMDLGGTTPESSMAPASTTSSAPLPPSSPPATTANAGGTYYQSRTQQPRAWRPGSTSDLRTL